MVSQRGGEPSGGAADRRRGTAARLLDPAHGTVTLTGNARAAYVPQNPNSLLFEPTVRREVEETLKLLGTRDNGDVDRWLDALGLHELASRHPRSLSGGERQRIATARAFLADPSILILDEPSAVLTPQETDQLFRILATLKARGVTIVLITHEPDVAARAGRVLAVRDGEVLA